MLCPAGTAARGSRSPQPSGHRPPAGRCCPSKPCSNGPRSQPRQIRQHRGPERGALSCLWAPAPGSPVGSQDSSLWAQGQCPRQGWHPLSTACVLGPFPREPHPAQNPHLTPSNTPNLAPLGTSAQDRGPAGQVGHTGASGDPRASLPYLRVQLEHSWDGHPVSLLPWCWGVGGMGTPDPRPQCHSGWVGCPGAPSVGVWVGWMSQGAGVTPVSWQLGHGRQCVLDVGDQREPEPP